MAEGERVGVEVIPGVELGVDVAGGELHLLGYLFDWRNPDFQVLLQRLRDGRLDRAAAMVRKLAELGMPLDYARVRELAGEGAVGRPHIARAMLEQGYVTSFEEAFERWLGDDRPAYVGRERLTLGQAVRWLRTLGGVAVLAHPLENGIHDGDLPGLVREGIAGLECYYWGYDEATVGHLLALARQYHLVPTGGSDFHGFGALGDESRNLIGSVYVPDDTVDRLRAAASAASRGG